VPSPAATPEARVDPSPHRDEDGAWRRVQSLLGSASPSGGWALAEFGWLETEGGTRGLVAVYGRADGSGRVAVLLEPPDASKRSYARTAGFNVSYLPEWEGKACRFDEGLLAWCVAELRGIEGEPAERT
jgi:hypothetical protein